MNSITQSTYPNAHREPWNKGKLIGPKPPLRPKHVWAVRTKLQLDRRIRELALFNLAIDSKLRGCDVVSIRVGDVAPSGYAVDRATVRQRKTGKPVKFEIKEQTRDAIDNYLRKYDRSSGQRLFAARAGEEVRVSLNLSLLHRLRFLEARVRFGVLANKPRPEFPSFARIPTNNWVPEGANQNAEDCYEEDFEA